MEETNRRKGEMLRKRFARCKRAAVRHESLAAYWSAWNREYVEATYPRLVLRYEDLLFQPHKVAAEVCACAGGRVKPESDFVLPAKSVKAGHKGHGDGGSGRAVALRKYNETALEFFGDNYKEHDRKYLWGGGLDMDLLLMKLCY